VDVAEATARLLERQPEPGVYHCVNSGVATWLEIAEAGGRLLGKTPTLIPVSVASVQLRARRPQYCALSNEKLRGAGIEMAPWHDALERYAMTRLG
jgi:dTDP-4-dehydrorhamnose reductase